MTEAVDVACPHCPSCESQYSYLVGELKVCTECGHEWTPEAKA